MQRNERETIYDLKNVNNHGQACLWNAGPCGNPGTSLHTKTAANYTLAAALLTSGERFLDFDSTIERPLKILIGIDHCPTLLPSACQLLVKSTTWPGLLGSTVDQLLKVCQLSHWH
jgi:hypothetical protein